MAHPPPLVVAHPPGYGPERAYALDVVLGTILGVGHVASEAARDDVSIGLAGETGAVRLPDVLFATPRERWLTAATLPAQPLARLPVGGAEPLPLLYRSGAVPALAPGETWLDLDVFGSAFFLLTRLEELVRPERDEHDRFPAGSSVAVQEQFIERPLVHEYADVLWDQLRACWPRLKRPARTPRTLPSHDVDWPWLPQRTAAAAARGVVGDLVRRRDPRLALDRTRWTVAQRRGVLAQDPYDTFDQLMDVSEAAGARSAFYFMAGVTRPGLDGGYGLDDPRTQAILRRVHARGHEIGLHPSYESYQRPEVVAAELRALREAAARLGIEQDEWGGRQHFLRWENPTTWQAWEDAGLAYDSTLTFPARAGFRTGACVDFPAFNLRTARRLRLRERPLIVMEGSLLQYERASHAEAEAVMLRLRERCRRVGGNFTLLWHNSSLLSRRDERLYRRLLA